MRFTHVENEYLQSLVEGGILGGGALVWAAIRLGRRLGSALAPAAAPSALDLGLAGGLVASLVHSLFDFNLHIPANGLAFAIGCGLVCGAPGLGRETVPRSPAVPVRVVIALSALALGALGVVRLARGVEAQGDAARARRLLEVGRLPTAREAADASLARSTTADALETRSVILAALGTRAGDDGDLPARRHLDQAAADDLERALLRRPSDHDLHRRLGLVRLRQGRSAEALGLLERAVQLGRARGYNHLVLGQALVELGREDEAAEPLARARALARQRQPLNLTEREHALADGWEAIHAPDRVGPRTRGDRGHKIPRPIPTTNEQRKRHRRGREEPEP